MNSIHNKIIIFKKLVAAISSYTCDLKKYENHLNYSFDDMLQEYKDYGFYTKYKLEHVPIQDIKMQDVWDQNKFKSVVSAIDENKEMPPVMLEKENNKYLIIDGIHRIQASKTKGLLYVPALVSEVFFEKPEMTYL
jgi:hypothetical protein